MWNILKNRNKLSWSEKNHFSFYRSALPPAEKQNDLFFFQLERAYFCFSEWDRVTFIKRKYFLFQLLPFLYSSKNQMKSHHLNKKKNISSFHYYALLLVPSLCLPLLTPSILRLQGLISCFVLFILLIKNIKAAQMAFHLHKLSNRVSGDCGMLVRVQLFIH